MLILSNLYNGNGWHNCVILPMSESLIQQYSTQWYGAMGDKWVNHGYPTVAQSRNAVLCSNAPNFGYELITHWSPPITIESSTSTRVGFLISLMIPNQALEFGTSLGPTREEEKQNERRESFPMQHGKPLDSRLGFNTRRCTLAGHIEWANISTHFRRPVSPAVASPWPTLLLLLVNNGRPPELDKTWWAAKLHLLERRKNYFTPRISQRHVVWVSFSNLEIAIVPVSNSGLRPKLHPPWFPNKWLE